MKKNIIVSMVGVAAAGLLLASCSAKPESVTAVVGPDGQPTAVVVKYAKAVSAESVAAEAFVVDGQEVEAVFVTDKDITTPPEKPECKAEKPECDSTKACPEAKPECDSQKACPEAKPEAPACKENCGMDPKECEAANHECCPEEAPKAECKGPESKDGQFVVIVLKKACPEAKPECCQEEKHDCGMDPKECEAAKHECCPEEKPEKPECDSTKTCPEGKPECNKAEKPEIAVPAISVNQVKDIKAADGSVLKAWGKAAPATKAVPCMGPKGPKGHKHHGPDCPDCEQAPKADAE